METMMLANGYIAIKLSKEECSKAELDVECLECEKEITGQIYYLPSWHQVMCKSCLDKYETQGTLRPADIPFEIQMIGKLVRKLAEERSKVDD